MDEAERNDAIRRVCREGDSDRYLATLFVPAASRDKLFALYALNVELARIGAEVSEPALGEIRLQWWRDALGRAAFGDLTGSPIADAVGALLGPFTRPGGGIGRLIDARQFDISVKIMPDRAALHAYLDGTAGALFTIAAECLGAPAASSAPAAKAAGLAYGLTGLMRALPAHAAGGRVDLPADMLAEQGISPAQILSGTSSAGLERVLGALRGEARAALLDAKRHVAQLPSPAQAAFLPLSLVDPYLRALEKVAGDPFRKLAAINPLHRLWRLATWRIEG